MPTLTRDQRELAAALERVITWLREARDPQGISASALSALSRLESSGPLRVTDLADREGLSQPGMTTLIHRLEEADLAVREPDPTDRRAVRVSITPAGIQRVIAYRSARTDLIGARLDQLSPEHQLALQQAVPALDQFVVAPIPTPDSTPQQRSIR
jgi:DNA-binding MarR family transcriptional regulator